MSHFVFDQDYFEVVTHSVPCPCNGRCNGCCIGSISTHYLPRPAEEIAKIKAQKQLEREEMVLAEAERIRARRVAA